MTEVGRTVSEGITFQAKSRNLFRIDVGFAKYGGQLAFHWDNRKVWIYRLAALATDGEGYREIGQPSLHCATGSDTCNVHIDEFGFVAFGPDGKEYFTPDSLRHSVDELVWRAKIRPKLMLGLNKAHLKFIGGPTLRLMDQSYIVAPSFEFTCGNRNCSENSATATLSPDL